MKDQLQGKICIMPKRKEKWGRRDVIKKSGESNEKLKFDYTVDKWNLGMFREHKRGRIARVL